MEVFKVSNPKMLRVVYQPKGRAGEYGEWAVNLYGGHCPHLCKYCYVSSALRVTRETWEKKPFAPRDNLLNKLKKDLMEPKDIKQIFLCFTCDPYPCGVDSSLTREVIKEIHAKQISVSILTKGGMAASRDYDLLSKEDQIGATLTFTDDKQSAEWEPGAALPKDRIEMLQKAKSIGIQTWASLEPVIDPAQSLEIIRQTHAFVDLFKVGKMNHHPAAKGIDWHKFGWQAKELLEKLGCNYYLKHDLRQAMKIAI
jgi:DNA repair photolyase